MKVHAWLFTLGVLFLSHLTLAADSLDVAGLVADVNSVGPKGEGHSQAIAACHKLLEARAEQIPEILKCMKPDAPLASNWLRPVVDVIAQRAADAGNGLPLDDLELVLADTSLAARGRRVAFELIVQAEPAARQRLVAGLLNDPSPELRRDAVAFALEDAQSKSGPAAVAAYRIALNSARDKDQIDLAAEQLRERGLSVDLARHFGFLQRWKLTGPFDNTDMKGFDVAYGPERDSSVDASYQGKSGPVSWTDCTIDDEYGLVDLNQVVGKLKAAVIYARAEFLADEARDVDIRLGCINANKVWLNGELLTATNIYHSGTYIDQYIGHGRLKAGKNVILVKVLQNEQTEDWAQRWQFQLRVCDRYGTAVLSTDRDKETNE